MEAGRGVSEDLVSSNWIDRTQEFDSVQKMRPYQRVEILPVLNNACDQETATGHLRKLDGEVDTFIRMDAPDKREIFLRMGVKRAIVQAYAVIDGRFVW
jgi:hypothetical protein